MFPPHVKTGLQRGHCGKAHSLVWNSSGLHEDFSDRITLIMLTIGTNINEQHHT